MRADHSTFLLLTGALSLMDIGELAAQAIPSTRPVAVISEPAPPVGAAQDNSGSEGSTLGPNELIRSKWAAVHSVLQTPGLDTTAKKVEIERIVGPVIDFALMGKLALGRAHWSQLTAAQRRTYLQRFEKRVKRSYGEKIALYEDEDVRIDYPRDGPSDESNAFQSEQASGKKTQTASVKIELLSKGKPATVLHKLRWFDKRWRIYDVEIEGISILLTYRSQFHDILRTRNVEELLSRLQTEPPG